MLKLAKTSSRSPGESFAAQPAADFTVLTSSRSSIEIPFTSSLLNQIIERDFKKGI